VDRFSKFFHQLIHKEILYVNITKISALLAIVKFEKRYQIFTLNMTSNVFN